MFNLSGKVALITGGVSGIGLATSNLFAKAGATVIFSDIDQGKGAALEAEHSSFGYHSEFICQDVTNEAQWDEVVDSIVAKHGKLDVIVNNAGIALIGSVEDISLKDWQKTIDVNLNSVFMGTKAGIRVMKKNGGSIINVSSIEGMVGEPLIPSYNASKGGVRIFTKSAALHCADFGYPVRINSIHPGFVGTPMVAGAMATMEPSAAQAFGASVMGRIPVKRFAEPDEIAYPILFLASDASTYMTGSELVVDGGMTAR